MNQSSRKRCSPWWRDRRREWTSGWRTLMERSGNVAEVGQVLEGEVMMPVEASCHRDFLPCFPLLPSWDVQHSAPSCSYRFSLVLPPCCPATSGRQRCYKWGVGGGSSLKYMDCSHHWPDIMYPFSESPLLTKATIVCRLNQCPPPRIVTTNMPLHRYESAHKTALLINFWCVSCQWARQPTY